MQCKYSYIQATLNSCFCWLWMQKCIFMHGTDSPRKESVSSHCGPALTQTQSPGALQWSQLMSITWKDDLSKSKSSCWSFRHTDLYDNDEEERHISGKVDFVNLEHRRAQTKDQNPDNNLDGLRRARKSRQHIMQHIWNFLMRKNALNMSPNIALKIPMCYI